MTPSNAVPTLADVAPAAEHHLAAALAALTQDVDVLAVTRDWRDLIEASEVRSVAVDLIVQALAELARLDAYLKTPAPAAVWMRSNRGNALTRHALARTARFDTSGKEADTGTEWRVAHCGSKLAGAEWAEGSPVNDMSQLPPCRRCAVALARIKTPARRDPSPITVRTVATTGGPATFSLPATPEPPRFSTEVWPPGTPPPPPPPHPRPGPPPPVGRCAQGWPSPSTPWPPPIAIGVGPQYDALPRWDR
jgi:hypothetical protein